VLGRAALVVMAMGAAGCGPSEHSGVVGSVMLGDNFVAPDLALDEDFFYCRIQPEVITKYGCASGMSGEEGMCHDSKSALRLIDTKEKASCDKGGMLTGNLPDAFVANFEAARFFVQSDPLTSPLYLRPIRKASHPRQIFPEGDAAAKLIVQWISAGAR
jgi:hypothetical protein